MLLKRDEFLNSAFSGIGVCGIPVPRNGSDAVHVGVFWKWENEFKVAHFQGANDIELAEALDIKFTDYYFVPLPDFWKGLIASFIPQIKLICAKKQIGLGFNMKSVVYRKGKFNLENQTYTVNDKSENYINCAVFVLIVLDTFFFELLDTDTWPFLTHEKIDSYLEQWLDHQNIIDKDERLKYYQFGKEIRGKHVLPSSNHPNHPVEYCKAVKLANDFLMNVHKKTNL